LLAADGRAAAKDPAVERAVEWLVSRQNADGTWDEAEFTGTGFPRVFYLKYHLYRNSFPLYALARYDNVRKGRARSIGVQIRAEEIEHPNGYWG
jgi:squalene-hopene/tetraprenyl-beta-curcumene cyclase